MRELLPQSSEKNDACIRNEKTQQFQTEVRLTLYQELHNDINVSNHKLDVFQTTSNNFNKMYNLANKKCEKLWM